MKRNLLAEQGGFDLLDSTERRFARNIMRIDVTRNIDTRSPRNSRRDKWRSAIFISHSYYIYDMDVLPGNNDSRS